jgi:SAM-dependent methyltransferase
MNDLPNWVPEGIDVTVPNVARMYDYALGGYHNFTVDRENTERAEQALPGTIASAQANRAFLYRVVRWLAGAGITQFLDIGSGIPTVGNVHEIAEQATPGARTMYIDIDPIAVAHSQAILAGNQRAKAMEGDLREPIKIVDHPDVTGLLDLSKPVAVLITGVMHFISDADDPRRIITQLKDAVVSGSYIVVSHIAPMPELENELANLQEVFQKTPTPFYLRTREQLAELLTGLEIVEPGIVPIPDWHPDSDDHIPEHRRIMLVAVGRKDSPASIGSAASNHPR